MTQTRLAELAEMTIARVSDYLNGKRDVQAETLRRMLETLGLEVGPGRARRVRRNARRARTGTHRDRSRKTNTRRKGR